MQSKRKRIREIEEKKGDVEIIEKGKNAIMTIK